MARLVLASASPRRRELMKAYGYNCEWYDPAVEEVASGMPPHLLARENARRKASAGRERDCEVVIAADTIVVLDGEVFGKPTGREGAIRMLGALSGRVHEVITAVCLLDPARNALCQFEDVSRVKFKSLPNGEAEAYVDEMQPLDKAGAYAAQDDNGRLIEQIEGSFTNVVGLPMERFELALSTHFGVSPFGS